MEGLKKSTVELTSIPYVPNNIIKEVFDDDKHILDFLTNSNIFLTQIIDEEEAKEAEFDPEEIMNLKINTIPRGMIQLEKKNRCR